MSYFEIPFYFWSFPVPKSGQRRSRKAKQWTTTLAFRGRAKNYRYSSVFVIWSQRADHHRRAHPDWTRIGCSCCLLHRGWGFEWECCWPSAMRSASCEDLEWKCQQQFRYPCCNSVTHCSFTVHTVTNAETNCRQPFSFSEVLQSEFARFKSRYDDWRSWARWNVRRKPTRWKLFFISIYSKIVVGRSLERRGAYCALSKRNSLVV